MSEPSTPRGSVGLGILEGARLYIFGMQTLAPFRQPWTGKAIAASLAAQPLRKTPEVSISRERENTDVRQFYPSLEFETVYAFHYRTLFCDD